MTERPLIQLNDEAYESFVAALEAPAKPNARLIALLSRRTPWD